MHFFKRFYEKTLKYDFINAFDFGVNSCYNLPKFKKIILNFNIKTNNIKKLSSSLLALELISKQQSKFTKAKKSNIILKIRKGDPIGCKLIIKKKLLFNFLSWIILEILPKFKGIIFVNWKSNLFMYQFWNIFYFSELKRHYIYFFNLPELNVLIITSLINKKKLSFLFKSLQFPVTQKF